jgi:hypothetical protein
VVKQGRFATFCQVGLNEIWGLRASDSQSALTQKEALLIIVRDLLTTGILVLAAQSALANPSPVRWTASAITTSVSAQPSKKDVLARLKTVQDQQISEATELEKAIRKQLNEAMTIDVKDEDLNLATHRTSLVTKKIDELNKRRSELNARREIVDRLIFQVDSKWSSQKLQDFLSQAFIEMASTDLADGRDNKLWKELTYLSMVVRDAPEASEDMIGLVEGFLKFSNVLEPKTPGEYIASRNYTNGAESQMAHVTPRESLGDGLDAEASVGHGSKEPVTLTIKSSLSQLGTAGSPTATTSSTTQSASDLTTAAPPTSAAGSSRSSTQVEAPAQTPTPTHID